MSKPRKYKPGESKLDLMLEKAIPSQLPVVVVSETYQKMIKHCTTQELNLGDLWACSKTGAKVHAKMMRVNIFNPKTLQVEYSMAPVAWLYCSSCHKPPLVKPGDGVWSSELMTVTL